MKFFSIRRKRGQGRRLSRSVALSTGVVVVVMLVALLLAGFTSEGREQVLQPQQEAVMKVQTAKVVVSKLLQDLNSFGTISYSKKNDVTLQVEGVLQQLLVKEGDKVTVVSGKGKKEIRAFSGISEQNMSFKFSAVLCYLIRAI